MRTVGGDEGGVVATAGEPFPGQFDELSFDVHAVHVLAPEAMRQQCGVVSGACADLQHSVSRLNVECFEHSGHQARHAGRGQPTGQHEQRGVGIRSGQIVGGVVGVPVSGVRVHRVVHGY